MILENSIGWKFYNPKWIKEALTHSTFSNEKGKENPNNQRLEFLGDATIELIVSDILYNLIEYFNEGQMTRYRASVVCKDALVKYAFDLNLEEFIQLGKGQEYQGKTDSILADTFEALVGAVFMDAGFEVAKKTFAPIFKECIKNISDPIDFKSHLQELCHKKKIPQPIYIIVSTKGLPHARSFICEARLQDYSKRGQGTSKKIAEQNAAKEILNLLIKE